MPKARAFRWGRAATSQFALDERSLFPGGDSDALAERIDWWIEHPEERREMELRYAEHATQHRHLSMALLRDTAQRLTSNDATPSLLHIY